MSPVTTPRPGKPSGGPTLALSQGQGTDGLPLPPALLGKGPASLGSEPHPSPGGSVQTVTPSPTSQPEAQALRPEMAAVTVLPPHPMVTPEVPAGEMPPAL